MCFEKFVPNKSLQSPAIFQRLFLGYNIGDFCTSFVRWNTRETRLHISIVKKIEHTSKTRFGYLWPSNTVFISIIFVDFQSLLRDVLFIKILGFTNILCCINYITSKSKLVKQSVPYTNRIIGHFKCSYDLFRIPD